MIVECCELVQVVNARHVAVVVKYHLRYLFKFSGKNMNVALRPIDPSVFVPTFVVLYTENYVAITILFFCFRPVRLPSTSALAHRDCYCEYYNTNTCECHLDLEPMLVRCNNYSHTNYGSA